jgi:hypothetical protein
MRFFGVYCGFTPVQTRWRTMPKRVCAFLLPVALLIMPTYGWALLRVGLKAGVNLADVQASHSHVSYSIKPGFSAGAMAEVPISPGGLMAARAELLYVQKGAKTEDLGQKGKLLIDEVVFAPFLVFYLPSVHIRPFLEGGPEFGLNTLAKSKTDGAARNIGPQWSNNNTSLNLGAGILIPAGGGDWVVDARYNLGLTDLSVGGGNIKTKTNGIQIFLGYNFLKL